MAVMPGPETIVCRSTAVAPTPARSAAIATPAAASSAPRTAPARVIQAASTQANVHSWPSRAPWRSSRAHSVPASRRRPGGGEQHESEQEGRGAAADELHPPGRDGVVALQRDQRVRSAR